MVRRSHRRGAGSFPQRIASSSTPAELLEQRLLLTAYVVNTLDDAVAIDGKLSLREAVQAASLNAAVNEAAAGQAGSVIDTISFNASLAGGTIVLSGTRLDVAGALFIGGLGASQLAISGNDSVQIFSIAAAANVQISNLTLTHGYGAHAIETFDGGTIANQGVLSLTSVIISHSTATFRGAAIFNEGSVTMTGGVIEDSTGTDAVENSDGSFSATNTIFRRNLAGSIHNWKNVSIVNGLFEDNAGVSGSAIDNFGFDATVVVTGSRFLRNAGGALKNQGKTFQIVDSTFVGNTNTSAGAIENFSGIMEITGSTFTQNQATVFHGGAIESSSTLRVSNSTFSGNEAAWNGGAFYLWTGDATFRNVTVFGNHGKADSSLGDGGGFYITGASVMLFNSIVAGNVIEADGSIAQDIVGTVGGRNNLIGTAAAAGGLVDGTNGNIVGVDWTTVLDPVLRNNGGATLTHALLGGGAAVNAGLNSAALDPQGLPLAVDQRGLRRIASGVVDLGAVELPTSVIVDSLADGIDGNFSPGNLSLREAVALVETGGTITFASNLAGGTIALTTGQLVLDRDVSIVGLGADQITIGAAGQTVFYVNNGVSATLRDLTLRRIVNFGSLSISTSAITNGSTTDTVEGGGIYNLGSLVIADSSITGNVAAAGGGIFNSAGTVTITSSTISGNTARFSGGGIANVSSGRVTITNSSISENASGGSGGGLADVTLPGSPSVRTIFMTNSTVSGNTAAKNGGGLALAGLAELRNVTITRNRSDADGDGQGIAGGLSLGGDLQLFNSIVAGNVSGQGDGLASDVAGLLNAASSHNLIGDAATAGGLANGINGNIVGVDWRTVLDPVLRNNGGPTLTHALLRGSVAVDAGDDAEAVDADGNPLPYDQRGLGFVRVLRGRADIGAFELVNASPVAVKDAFSINEDQSITGSLFANHGAGIDADADGDALEITLVTINGNPVAVGSAITLASGALLTVNADGSFTFATNDAFRSLTPGQTATQVFTYSVSDGHGGVATATVTITIRGINVTPVAVNDDLQLGEAGQVTGNVLANDSDADGASLVVSAINGNPFAVGKTITLDSGARLTLNANGTFTYDPGRAFVRLVRGQVANDGFSYSITDGFNGTTASVSIRIIGGGGEDGLIGFFNGAWQVATSDAVEFSSGAWDHWSATAWVNATALRQGDFNGDGLTDVLGLLRGAWWVGLSNGTSFMTTRWGGWSSTLDWKNVTVGDVDGDGDDDVMASYRGSWWVSLSTGTAFATPTRWTGWGDLAWQHVTLTDLNGDGDADLLANLNGAWWASLSMGNTFRVATRWGGLPRLNWESFGAFDVNNDGRTDVYAFSRGTWYVGTSNGSRFDVTRHTVWRDAAWKDAIAGDFNDDGRDDFAARLGGNWWVSLTRNDGSAGPATRWALLSNTNWDDVQVGDFDGDGRDDIALRSGGEWQVARSTGHSFEASVWGNWDKVEWQAVAASAVASDVPPLMAPPADEAPLARFWSMADDDEKFARLLLSAV